VWASFSVGVVIINKRNLSPVIVGGGLENIILSSCITKHLKEEEVRSFQNRVSSFFPDFKSPYIPVVFMESCIPCKFPFSFYLFEKETSVVIVEINSFSFSSFSEDVLSYCKKIASVS